MIHRIGRRDFVKSVLGSSVAAPFVADRSKRALAGVAAGSPSEPNAHLEWFNYDGVRLLDGMLKKQFQETRDFYNNIPEDDALKGFRERAGLPAPGNSLGGWYGGEPEIPDRFKDWWMWGDTFNAFGQWLSGMARMSKATNDSPLREKAVRLLREWAKTIESDGYSYYSRKPLTNHYTYEKTVCGLLDIYEYCGEKEALPLLEKITDWAIKNLDLTRRPTAPNPQDWASQGVEWYTLGESSTAPTC